ncbi:hypothetical protein SDC9_113980 [bioreactor metagenome]|uniref:Uncharacterized protein n=1 Tax=bioreactor metagenome TaxID=1076179 RepID=A0A645BZB9_9ZZZZ
MLVWKNRMLPEISRIAKFRIPVGEGLFLRQCASWQNLFHLPSSYRYPTGSIQGYITRLNWTDEFIILEKEHNEAFEYFIIDRRIESVKGPFTKEGFEKALKEEAIELPLIELSEMDWIINF